MRTSERQITAGFGNDGELIQFEREGLSLPSNALLEGYINNLGAEIWYSLYGDGNETVTLLHGGLGNGSNWGKQVPVLVQEGFRVVVIDSRGHGRSTRTEEAYSYEAMGSDVLAAMDHLGIARATFVGWSDGACTALLLGHRQPSRVHGVVFFGCNMDASGTKPHVSTPLLERCLNRHRKDYQQLSQTPGNFEDLMEAVGLMQRTQPNYSAEQLGQIAVPVLILQAEEDEFIRTEHAEYLHRQIPHSQYELLPEVGHFAPVQRPALFNAAILRFAQSIDAASGQA